MARGRIVADGSATEIKSVVSLRTIRATLPEVAIETVTQWPEVQEGERHGDTIVLRCNDSDAVLRRLLATYEQARDVEVRSGGLDEAFRLLTSSEFEASS
jgi:ABC-2 type transport system ATP-binding protein